MASPAPSSPESELLSATWKLWADPAVIETFWSYVDKDGPVNTLRPDLGPCWMWNGKRFSNGYGRLNIRSQSVPAHRLSWEIDNAQTLAPELVPDHLCMTKLCVRPHHLDPCTRPENTRRWSEQTITQCPKGHPYTPENTVFDGEWRRCRKCRAEYEATRRVRIYRGSKGKNPGRRPNLSSKLGWLIDQSGFALFEVGAASGVSYTHMSEYVNMKHPIRPRHLVGLCDFFNLEPEDIEGPSGLDKKGNPL